VKLLDGKSAGGFEAQRALYNVMRQADLSSGWFAPIFGPGGFICSEAARPLVENAGFDQLATPANGGDCGKATQAATTNFRTNHDAALPTTTGLTGSASGRTVTLTATVTAGSGSPAGTVKFLEGAAQVATANLSGGVGIVKLANVVPGNHTYKAAYTPSSHANFTASESPASSVNVTVPVVVAKKASKTTVALATKFSKAKRMKAVVKVVSAGKAVTGKVRVLMGKKQLRTGTLTHGKVTIKLPKLKKGKHKLVFVYLGNSKVKSSAATKNVTVTK
jgi:hypothetical protein